MFKIISNFRSFVKKNHKSIYILLFICLFGGFSFLFGFCVGKKLIKKDNILVYGNIIKVSEILDQNKKEELVKEEVGVLYYVASSRGKYYYPNTCSLGKSLSPKNLIKFNTEEEAKKAGYVYNTRCD